MHALSSSCQNHHHLQARGHHQKQQQHRVQLHHRRAAAPTTVVSSSSNASRNNRSSSLVVVAAAAASPSGDQEGDDDADADTAAGASASSRGGPTSSSSAPPPPPASVIITRRGNLTWASCVSTRPSVAQAVESAVATIQAQWDTTQQQQQQQQQQQGRQNQLDGSAAPFEPNLALVFASCNYGPQLQDVVAAVRRAAPSVQHIFGCSAYGVCGSSPLGPTEVEGEPGVSISLAQLPGVELSLVHTLRSGLPSEDAPPELWADLVGVSPVTPLTQSPPPSGNNSDEEEEEEGEGEGEGGGGGEREGQEQEQQQLEVKQQQQSAAEKQPAAGGQEALQQEQQEEEQRPQADSSSSSSKSSSNIQAAPSLPSQQPPQPPPSAAAAAANTAVSFLVLCDPKFPQVRQLLAGLDFAFPDANKAGIVLSQGQQNRKRVMFAWSAAGGVEAGSAAWREKRKRRRQQQQAEATKAAAAAAGGGGGGGEVGLQEQEQQEQQQQQKQLPSSQPPQSSSSSSSSKKGLFSGLFGSLLSGLSESDGSSSDQQKQQQQQQQQGSSPANGSSSSREAAAAAVASSIADAAAGGSSDSEEDDDSDDSSSSSGVFMYGAAVLSIKGPLVLEPLTCQGYRTVSKKVWVVGNTSRDGDLIMNLLDPEEEEDDSSSSGAQNNNKNNSKSNGSDSDSDDDDDGEDDGERNPDGSVPPLLGLYDLVESVADEASLDEVGDKVAVAIAPDSWSPISALTPEQYTVAAISEVWSEHGFLRIDGQARAGHRIRFVLRDEEGMRDDLRSRLLGLKRTELAAVMAGRQAPQPLAAVLFSDIGRGTMQYQTPSYESTVVSSFLPVPLTGAFGAAQVSTVNGAGALYECTSVIGVLRALPQPSQQQQLGEAAVEAAE